MFQVFFVVNNFSSVYPLAETVKIGNIEYFYFFVLEMTVWHQLTNYSALFDFMQQAATKQYLEICVGSAHPLPTESFTELAVL